MKTAILLIVIFFTCRVLCSQELQRGNHLQAYISTNSADAAAWLVNIRPEAVAAFIQKNHSLLLRQLSPTAFILAGNAASSVIAHPSVLSVYAANSYWKLSPRLLRMNVDLSAGKDQQYDFLIHCINADSLRNELASKWHAGATFTYAYKNAFQLRASWAFIRKYILANENIIFVDLPNTAPKEELSVANFDNSLNRVNQLHNYYPALDGSNTVVSVKENKPDEADIDFKGRLIFTTAASNTLSTHASTMATIIAGGGNSFYTARGVAPAAHISSSSFAVLLPDADAFYQQYRIAVQNHSYGTGIENFYGADAAAYDASTNSNPSLLHIFSAGNAGSMAPPDGQYAGINGFSNITGSFKMAKNIITTGAVDSFNTVAPLSSKGPAYDGRIKPDMVAFGEDGSSGAAALVSGTALVLQQAYKETHDGVSPDAALVKAILLNTASPVDSNPISFSAGYGSLDAYRAVLQLTAGQFIADSLAQGGTRNIPLTVPAAARNLKILLSWTDPAAAPNAFAALVNDLDLRVTHTASGLQWLPWVLNSFPHKDSLQLPATRKRDSLNNIEQVSIDSPTAGDYTIVVTGSKIRSGPQKFYIVYQWDEANSFEWTYPTKNDNLLPGKQQLPRWKTNYTGAGLLEYKYAGSNQWQAAGSISSVKANYTKWLTPDTSAVAMLRVTINGNQYLSDSFTLSAPVQLAVGFNCPDTALLFWNRQMATSKYAVFKLGDKYMEPHSIVTDTAVFISKNSTAASWFNAAPLLPFNKTGIYSQAIDYTTQGINCYLSGFTADLTGSKVSLVISLGTLFRVQRVVVEKINVNGAYLPLRVLPSPLQQQYSLTDDALYKGVNQYRIRIELSTGQVIYSNAERVIYLAGNDYMLYPNPVHRPQPINIITADLGNQVLRVFNVWCQQVYMQKISDLSTQLSTVSFAKGVYFYTILKDGKMAARGKLVVD